MHSGTDSLNILKGFLFILEIKFYFINQLPFLKTPFLNSFLFQHLQILKHILTYI